MPREMISRWALNRRFHEGDSISSKSVPIPAVDASIARSLKGLFGFEITTRSVRFTGDASLRCMKQILANSRPSLPVNTATGRAVPFPTSSCFLATRERRAARFQREPSQLPTTPSRNNKRPSVRVAQMIFIVVARTKRHETPQRGIDRLNQIVAVRFFRLQPPARPLIMRAFGYVGQTSESVKRTAFLVVVVAKQIPMFIKIKVTDIAESTRNRR